VYLGFAAKAIPQLGGEFAVCCSQCWNESTHECLDSAFGCIGAMVMQLNKMQFAIIFDKKSFNVLCCLIIHDVQFWFECF
jgi:hypothetical protein